LCTFKGIRLTKATASIIRQTNIKMSDENLILILTYPCWHCGREALVLPSNVVRVTACLKGKDHVIVNSFYSDNQVSNLDQKGIKRF
jgi:hypothetical protein